MLLLTLSPFLIGGLVLYYRWREYRRIRAMTQETAGKLNRTAEDLAESAKRQIRMIELLTEIRDRLPPPPQAPPAGS